MITDVVKAMKGVLERVSREIMAQLMLCAQSCAVWRVRLLVAGAMASLRGLLGVPGHNGGPVAPPAVPLRCCHICGLLQPSKLNSLL